MSKDDDSQFIEMTGIVDSICRDLFTVSVDDAHEMKCLCKVSGKIRVSGIKILPGDTVKIMISAYDTSKGRIIYRMKKED